MFGLFSKLKIGAKISAILLIVVLISVLAVSFFAYNQSKNAVEERYLESLNGVADLKVQKVQTFINEVNSAVQIGQDLKPVKSFLKTSVNKPAKQSTIEDITDTLPDTPIARQDTIPVTKPDTTAKTIDEGQANIFADGDINLELENAITTIQFTFKLNNIYLLDKDGNVLYISRETPEQIKGAKFKMPAVDQMIVSRGKDTTYFSKVTLQQLGKEKKSVFLVSAPVRDFDDANADKVLLGQLVYEIDMARVETLISDRVGLGKTGQVLLLQEQDDRIVYLNNSKNKNIKISSLDNAGSKTDPSTASVILRSLKKETRHREAIDERDYLAVSRFVPGLEWGMVVKNDKSEIYAPADALLNRFLIAGLIVIFISLLIGILFSQLLTRPLSMLQKTIEQLAKGELPPVLDSQSEDEIGEMTERINSLSENLNKTAIFAQKIGNQDFETEFTPVSDQDILGNALINARDSLVASAEANNKENWVVSRLAEVGDILRATDNLNELSDKVLAYVVKESGAIQGAFYVMRKENNAEVDYLEMIASYAYNKRKYLNAKFKYQKNKYAEGLVGQAAIEQAIITRTEIPDDYVTITSGLLGDKKPTCLLITPLITNDTEVYGVIELASLDEFGVREVDFIKRISEITARTIFNITVNENTRQLLEEQQKLSQELKENEANLRKNAIELEKKNREADEANTELQIQVQNVQNEQRKTQVLLENASEVITIYEASGTIRYVSPSVRKILGYSPEEMIGLSDVAYIQEGTEAFEQMFEDLLRFPNAKETIQFSYKKKDGGSIWLEATGTNLLNDAAIEGIVINTRDITEKRKAEQEERMRGQMQALSENSADLILRMNREGKIFYINPIIENLTGHEPHKFLEKIIDTELVPQNVLNTWFKLVETSFRKGEKTTAQVDFDTIEGRKIMSINAIPEKNDAGGTETFLVVSHDITQQEADKERIAIANKKVTDSINYAKRIQSSILPDSTWMQAVFKDSFVMFKPKDIVSGDFPWMMQFDNTVYVAVVDCTGHGVPGALISLIAYFLLNNIFSTQHNLAPGEILDILDREVTKTLRQDQDDSVSKDGMDVSLCKINKDTKELQYSGAHRPLYYLDTHKPETEEPLEEVKGDKMPVGGGQYKNRGAFQTHTRLYQEGDLIIMFSDGLPDQFGGPDNRKFSPKRIRDVIRDSAMVPMVKINDAIEEELSIWMKLDGPNKESAIKQTDDILVIGIRF